LQRDNPIKKYILAFFIITILILLKYLGDKILEIDRKQMQFLKDEQLTNLSTYVKNMEAMYDDLRSFQRDYKNILISLNESIKTNDIDIVKKNYRQILTKEGIPLENNLYPLTKLNKLETLPIKSIFSSNIICAVRNKIQVNMEIEDTINNEPIETLDYIRVASILLENAIEAAKESISPIMNIAFIKDLNINATIIIIENSYDRSKTKIESSKLFNLGYSSKNGDRGRGLSIVDSILKRYKNISLETEINNNYFRQTLTLKELNKT